MLTTCVSKLHQYKFMCKQNKNIYLQLTNNHNYIYLCVSPPPPHKWHTHTLTLKDWGWANDMCGMCIDTYVAYIYICVCVCVCARVCMYFLPLLFFFGKIVFACLSADQLIHNDIGLKLNAHRTVTTIATRFDAVGLLPTSLCPVGYQICSFAYKYKLLVCLKSLVLSRDIIMDPPSHTVISAAFHPIFSRGAWLSGNWICQHHVEDDVTERFCLIPQQRRQTSLSDRKTNRHSVKAAVQENGMTDPSRSSRRT